MNKSLEAYFFGQLCTLTLSFFTFNGVNSHYVVQTVAKIATKFDDCMFLSYTVFRVWSFWGLVCLT